MLFFAALLYTKSSVVLAVLRKFFDGTNVKAEGEEARDNNVTSTALFSKLGKMAMYLLVIKRKPIAKPVLFNVHILYTKKLNSEYVLKRKARLNHELSLSLLLANHFTVILSTGEFLWPDLSEIIISECLKRSVPNTSAQVP